MNCLIESCTIHDDLHLNFNDIHEQSNLEKTKKKEAIFKI